MRDTESGKPKGLSNAALTKLLGGSTKSKVPYYVAAPGKDSAKPKVGDTVANKIYNQTQSKINSVNQNTDRDRAMQTQNTVNVAQQAQATRQAAAANTNNSDADRKAQIAHTVATKEAAAKYSTSTPAASNWSSGAKTARSGSTAASTGGYTAPSASSYSTAKAASSEQAAPTAPPVSTTVGGSTGGAGTKALDANASGRGKTHGQFKNKTNRKSPRVSRSLTADELKKAAASRVGL